MIRSAQWASRWWLACGLAIVSLTVFGTPNATAGKSVVAAFGSFAFPGGVAVNQATGDVYVVDAATYGESGGQRIEQFAADGELVRAWGWGVATGADAFEICSSSCLAGSRGAGDG